MKKIKLTKFRNVTTNNTNSSGLASASTSSMASDCVCILDSDAVDDQQLSPKIASIFSPGFKDTSGRCGETSKTLSSSDCEVATKELPITFDFKPIRCQSKILVDKMSSEENVSVFVSILL